jgi:hypothetical protein
MKKEEPLILRLHFQIHMYELVRLIGWPPGRRRGLAAVKHPFRLRRPTLSSSPLARLHFTPVPVGKGSMIDLPQLKARMARLEELERVSLLKMPSWQACSHS